MFIELSTPKQDNSVEMWFVRAMHERIFLTNEGDLEHEDFMDLSNIEKIFYDTEAEAFLAIQGYYTKHNRNNPYTAEWSAALNKMADDGFEDTVVESQVMVFE